MYLYTYHIYIMPNWFGRSIPCECSLAFLYPFNLVRLTFIRLLDLLDNHIMNISIQIRRMGISICNGCKLSTIPGFAHASEPDSLNVALIAFLFAANELFPRPFSLVGFYFWWNNYFCTLLLIEITKENCIAEIRFRCGGGGCTAGRRRATGGWSIEGGKMVWKGGGGRRLHRWAS